MHALGACGSSTSHRATGLVHACTEAERHVRASRTRRRLVTAGEVVRWASLQCFLPCSFFHAFLAWPPCPLLSSARQRPATAIITGSTTPRPAAATPVDPAHARSFQHGEPPRHQRARAHSLAAVGRDPIH